MEQSNWCFGINFTVSCYYRLNKALGKVINNVHVVDTCFTEIFNKMSTPSFIKVSAQDFIFAVERVFYENYDQIDRRMQIYSKITECCQKPYSCPMLHENSSHRPCSFKLNILFNSIFKHKFWSDGFIFYNFLLQSDLYPSPEITLKLLVLIFKTNNFKMIGTVCDTFNTMLEQNPPCAPEMQQYYFKVFTIFLEVQNKLMFKRGIFMEAIHELELTLSAFRYDNSVNSDDESVGSDDESVGSDDESVVCDSESDGYNSEPNESSGVEPNSLMEFRKALKLSRHKYLKRLCYLLKLIINAMESDLAVSLVKNGRNPKKELLTNPPLISILLQQENKSEDIFSQDLRKYYKPLIKMFVASVIDNISNEVTKVLSRLVALVGELLRVGDFKEKTTYPHFGRHCIMFAEEIHSTIISLSSVSIASVLDEIIPSWLAMLVANCRIIQFSKEIVAPSLETVALCLKALDHTEISLSSKPHVRKSNCYGETKIHLACKKRKLNLLTELLLQPDMDVNVRDNAGWTPLHEAVIHENYDCVLKLLESRPPNKEQGVDVRAKADKGQTPLMDAVQVGHVEICRILLLHGGKSLLKDRRYDGKTAQDLATSEDILKVLSETVPLTEANTSLRLNRVLFSSPPPQEVLDILHVLLKTYLDTYEVNNLKHRLKFLPVLPEDRTNKTVLNFDTVRAKRDIVYLEKITQLLKESKVLKANKEKINNIYTVVLPSEM